MKTHDPGNDQKKSRAGNQSSSEIRAADDFFGAATQHSRSPLNAHATCPNLGRQLQDPTRGRNMHPLCVGAHRR